jgi:hypothetical protein
MNRLDGIGGIDDFTDVVGILEEGRQLVPVSALGPADGGILIIGLSL